MNLKNKLSLTPLFHIIFWPSSLLVGVVIAFFTRDIREISKLRYPSNQDILELNEWGDYLGGVWGTLIALFSLIFTVFASYYVYKTYKNQKDQSYLELLSDIILKQTEIFNDDVNELEFEDYLGHHSGLRAIWRYNEAFGRYSYNYGSNFGVETPNLEFGSINHFNLDSRHLTLKLIKFFKWSKRMIEDERRSLKRSDVLFLYGLITNFFPMEHFKNLLSNSQSFSRGELRKYPKLKEYYGKEIDELKNIEDIIDYIIALKTY